MARAVAAAAARRRCFKARLSSLSLVGVAVATRVTFPVRMRATQLAAFHQRVARNMVRRAGAPGLKVVVVWGVTAFGGLTPRAAKMAAVPPGLHRVGQGGMAL